MALAQLRHVPGRQHAGEVRSCVLQVEHHAGRILLGACRKPVGELGEQRGTGRKIAEIAGVPSVSARRHVIEQDLSSLRPGLVDQNVAPIADAVAEKGELALPLGAAGMDEERRKPDQIGAVAHRKRPQLAAAEMFPPSDEPVRMLKRTRARATLPQSRPVPSQRFERCGVDDLEQMHCIRNRCLHALFRAVKGPRSPPPLNGNRRRRAPCPGRPSRTTRCT